MSLHNRTYRYLSSALLILALFISSCRKDDPIVPSTSDFYSGWDTVINDQGKIYPDADMVLRAVINQGDTNRLKRFFSKINEGRMIKMGFIGGSITEGALASPYEKCFITLTTSFLRKAFPSNTFQEVNCGIGATGSVYGCGRADDELLSIEPDLIVIEFSVNDQEQEAEIIKGTMEGLIRKCLNTDALVVMLVSKFRYDNPIPRAIHEGLGLYYNIPVISIGAAVDPLLQSSAIDWSYFFADDIHPNNNGHFLYAALLIKYLIGQYQNLKPDSPAFTVPHYLYTDLYETAGMFKSSQVSCITGNNGWSYVDKGYGRWGFESSTAGSELNFSVNWRQATLFYIFGPGLDARAEISVDGLPVDTLDNAFPGGWDILLYDPLFEQAIPNQRNIRIRNLTGGTFKITHLMYCL